MEEPLNFIVSVDALYRDVMIHFGSKESLKEELLRYSDEKSVETAMEAANFSGKGCTYINQESKTFFVWMPHIPKSSEDYGFLAHELFHAVVGIMQIIGVAPAEESEEVYAYVLGFLMEKTVERCFTSCHAQ